MSSQTTNIGLTLPAGSENVSRLIINENYTKIDDAVGELNERIDNLDPELPSALFTDLDFTLAVADWTLDSQTGLYNATITNTILLTATAGIQAFYDNSFRNALAGDIYATKSTGYVTFTTTEQPTGTLTGFIRIMDSTTGIVPTDRGGTGASTPRQARENLNTPIRDIFVDFGTVSSLPQTVYDADLRFGMVAFDAVFSNPSAIPGGIEVTFADPSGNLDGSVTITGTISGSTTISFYAHEKRTSVEGSETASETQRVQNFVQTNAQTLTATQKTQVLNNIGGASSQDLSTLSSTVSALSDSIATLSNSSLKHKSVTIAKNTAGTSWTQTSRYIGTTSGLFGLSPTQIKSLQIRNSEFTPSANGIIAMFNTGVYVAATQTTTLSSDVIVDIIYTS